MPASAPIQDDPDLDRIHRWLGVNRRLTDMGRAIRSAIDFVIDGGRTRRYSIDQLQPNEKTYIGNRVEHSILYELGLPKCAPFDTIIEKLPIDIKFTLGDNWMIPPEAVAAKALCVVVKADDTTSKFSVGVFRATESSLHAGSNRDDKKGISKSGRSQIRWVGEDAPLPPNFLLHLPASTRDPVLAEEDGQPAITQLFRLAVGIPVPRVAVETVARQLDPTKRVRDARPVLLREGIVILSRRYGGDEIEALGYDNFPADGYVSIKR